MRIRKTHLLAVALLSTASLAEVLSDDPVGPPVRDIPLSDLSANGAGSGPKPVPGPVPPRNSNPGTPDAPVDGQDGKPHDGPMISHDSESALKAGTGGGNLPDVGISGGGSSVDITNPPPVTGEHEITDLEGKEGVGEDSKGEHDLDPETSLSKSKTTEETPSEDGDDDGSEGTPRKPDSDFVQLDPDSSYQPPPKGGDSSSSDGNGREDGSIDSPFHSFTLSFIMILFSEIGDKTFLIAALMAMKHSRFLVFSAAFSSLIVMSILSAMLGHAVPTLIPKRVTSFLAAGLFLVFGVRMVNEGFKMEKGTANVQEEMKEVEQELEEKEAEAAIKRERSGSLSSRSLEEGLTSSRGANHLSHSPFQRSTTSPSLSDSDSESPSFRPRRKAASQSGVQSVLDGIQNLAGLLFSPAWVQTFVMTFLGEWGDRSQIATIAMAAGQDYWWVTLGTICGHSLCTAGAVIGGRYLASKISVRNVTLGGAGAFLVFGVIYLVEALYQ